jgi:hypothetical protein
VSQVYSFLAEQPTSRAGDPSVMIFVLLILILGACLWVFVELVRRETRKRRAVALAQWARSRDLRILSDGAVDSHLRPVIQFKPKVQSAIAGKELTLARIETAEAGVTTASAAQRVWNLLLRKVPGNWATTALRPTAHAVSAVDLFSLSSYPSLMPTDRFMVFGCDARSAQALAESSAPGLLPADIGLILAGDYLILDFSTRPFDEIEFDRVLDLANQLVPRLTTSQ